MKNLPQNMIPDRDNQVYYDTEKKLLYYIEWQDYGNGERPIRHYFSEIVPVQYKKSNHSKL